MKDKTSFTAILERFFVDLVRLPERQDLRLPDQEGLPLRNTRGIRVHADRIFGIRPRYVQCFAVKIWIAHRFFNSSMF